jgi:hypothetical protein
MPKSKKKKRITNLPYLQYNASGTDEKIQSMGKEQA